MSCLGSEHWAVTGIVPSCIVHLGPERVGGTRGRRRMLKGRRVQKREDRGGYRYRTEEVMSRGKRSSFPQPRIRDMPNGTVALHG